MIVARRAILDRARSMMWWSIGIAGLMLFTMALFPSIEGNSDFERLADNMPEAMRSLFSLDSAVPLTSAPGYLQARLYGSLLTVLLLVFAIGAGGRAVAGDEEDGTLELILMHPVARRRVLLERYGAVVALVLALAAVACVTAVVFGAPFGALEGVSLPGLAAANAGAGLIALLHGTIAFVVGAVIGRRAPAVGVAAAVAVVGYLVQGLAGLSDAVEPLRALSPWHWYLDRNMLAEGVPAAAFVLPVAVCAVLLVPAVVRFVRRDTGVG